DAALARELRKPREERRGDPAALMRLGDVHLVDEELRAVAVAPRQLVGEDEADRSLAVESDEEERPRIGEQSFRIPFSLERAQGADDIFVAGAEETDLDIR